MGPINYLRKSFDNLDDYPEPYEHESITDWVDRLHDMNISVNSIYLLQWFWPHADFQANAEGLLSRSNVKSERYLLWGLDIYGSTEEELMLLKLSHDGMGRIFSAKKPKE
jgi:hypothetical protein